jgi:Fuc2NAc and GlcNAc transferase
MSASIALLALAAGLASLVLTGVVRRLALRRDLLDRPNERSSHTVPTPRGGGLAIVAAVLAGLVTAFAAGLVSGRLTLALLGCGLVIAAIGFADDRRPVPAALRFGVHVAMVGVALFAIGGLPAVDVGGTRLPAGRVADLAALLCCVWFLNLFNFMDGIDGIAGAEAAFVSFASAGLLGVAGAGTAFIVPWLLLGAASLGFLAWNWAPAKIFMGDAGSGFTGFAIALLLVQSARVPGFSPWTALILTAPFASDATLTLVRRMLRGERWYSAHRSHAYQWLARRWRSHAYVTLLVVVLDLLVVLPLAILSVRAPALAPWVAALTLAAFLLAAGLAGSGRPERRDA